MSQEVDCGGGEICEVLNEGDGIDVRDVQDKQRGDGEREGRSLAQIGFRMSLGCLGKATFTFTALGTSHANNSRHASQDVENPM